MMAPCPAEPPIGGASLRPAAADPQAADLDDLLTLVPRATGAEMWAEMQAAAQAARDAPPPVQTIIPLPEYPARWPHEGAGTIRYSCALGCGWGHVEDTWTWTLGPVVFRPDDPDSLGRALTEQAEARAAAERDRIEGAFREHFATVHPGVEIPTRGVS